MPRAGRTIPTFTKSAPTISMNDYFSEIKRIVPSDRAVCFLTGACHLGTFFTSDNDLVNTRDQNSFTLPSLIIAAKETVNATYPLFTNPTDTFESCIEEAHRLYHPAEGIDFDFNLGSTTKSIEDALRVILWITSSNHQYQGDMIHEIANNLILSGIVGFQSLNADTTLLDRHFQNNVGVSGKDYFITLFALWSLTLKNFVINRNNAVKNSPRREQLEIALNSILDSLSFRVDEPLTSSIFDHSKSYSGKARSEAIVALRPLIKVHDDVYFSCGQPYMKIQITRKFLPKALFYARRDKGDPRTELSSFIGNRLEVMFKDLCNAWNPRGGHYDEYFIDRNEASKSSDRIAFEKHGNHDVAVLFQLKAKTLLEASLFGGDFNVVKKDIQSAFAEMIYKSVNYIKAAKEHLDRGLHLSESESLTRRVLSAKKLVLMGISPDVPAVFTSKPIREIIEEKVREEVGEDTWAWIHTNYDRVYWHIISLHEFEAFLCLPKNKQDFHKAISAYFKDSRLQTDPISNTGLPDSFRSYIIKKYKSANERGQYIEYLPALQSVFDSFMLDIKDHYFDPTSPKSDNPVPTSKKDEK